MNRYLAVTNLTRGRRLADRARLADRWWSRLRGLLGRGPLCAGEALILLPCRAVHMLGMRFPLDVAFLDNAGSVVAAYHGLAPGSRSQWHRRALLALEMPAGTLAATGTLPGDTLEWGPIVRTVGAT
jgi:uncharacterized membrane protein (UPF0127 family)